MWGASVKINGRLLPCRRRTVQLFIVSDGMGGEAHGEAASAMAVEVIADHCQASLNDPELPLYGAPCPALPPRHIELGERAFSGESPDLPIRAA